MSAASTITSKTNFLQADTVEIKKDLDHLQYKN